MTILEELVEADYGIEGRGRWKHASEHDSLVVDVENQKFFWNSTGLRGSAIDYLIKVRGMEKSEARNFLNNYFGAFKENSESSPQAQPYDKLVDVMWANGINHREYWYKRCLKDETIDRAKLGYYDGWNTVPMYDENFELVNFQLRREVPEKRITKYYRHTKSSLYNGFILKYAKKVFITEGTIDCILLGQYGLDAVSPNGGHTFKESWFPLFMNVKEIIYIADHDLAGLDGAKKVANILGQERVKIVDFVDKPEKFDSVDFFREEDSKDAFLEYVNKNSKYIFEFGKEDKKWKRF